MCTTFHARYCVPGAVDIFSCTPESSRQSVALLYRTMTSQPNMAISSARCFSAWPSLFSRDPKRHLLPCSIGPERILRARIYIYRANIVEIVEFVSPKRLGVRRGALRVFEGSIRSSSFLEAAPLGPFSTFKVPCFVFCFLIVERWCSSSSTPGCRDPSVRQCRLHLCTRMF